MEHLEDVEETIDTILNELSENEDIYDFKLDSIENFAGEVSGNLIETIKIEFKISRIVDYSEI